MISPKRCFGSNHGRTTNTNTIARRPNRRPGLDSSSGRCASSPRAWDPHPDDEKETGRVRPNFRRNFDAMVVSYSGSTDGCAHDRPATPLHQGRPRGFAAACREGGVNWRAQVGLGSRRGAGHRHRCCRSAFVNAAFGGLDPPNLKFGQCSRTRKDAPVPLY